MGDQNGEPPASEVVVAAPPRPHPATQAQAPATQAHQAPATQAHQAPATQAQAHALATQAQAHALATQAQALAAQAIAFATQAQALLGFDTELTADEKKVLAYREIANLQDINLHYPIHKLALEEWQRKEEYLSYSVSRREGRSAELTNQIYNIFGWFAVFQGVVLTAVSQLTQTTDSEPLCRKIWFPIVLTGFASLSTVVGILHKFTSLKSLESTIHTEKQAKIEVAKRASCLRREGPKNFKFHVDADNSKDTREAKLYWRNRLLVILSLGIFTFIFIMSYFIILCDTWVV